MITQVETDTINIVRHEYEGDIHINALNAIEEESNDWFIALNRGKTQIFTSIFPKSVYNLSAIVYNSIRKNKRGDGKHV